ncbi:MAG: autotransporter-associated beta strand repeat-containing protein [Verrucomicrobiaceae bacterium]|nr:autotransporter-associated beta strand repeat-containing protein [Verrucomicrobiaceae bacterium]
MAIALAGGVTQNWSVGAGRTLRIDNIISGATAGLNITGSTDTGFGGTVDLRGVNTFTGATTVTGSALALDYATAGSRIDAASSLTLNRASLAISGGSTGQTINGLTLGTGANQITFAGTTANLNVGAITRSGFDSLLNVGTTARATTSTGNTNGILGGWAVVNKTDWAVGGGSITALATYLDRTGAWTDVPLGTENVRTTGSVTAVSSDTINSLKLGGFGAFTQSAGTTLNIVSGGILKNDNTTDTTISGGTLTAGVGADAAADTMYIWTNQRTSGIIISSVLADNGGDVLNLVKAGDGGIRFDNTAAHTMTGTLTITGGRVMLGNNNTVGTLPGTNVVFAITPGSSAATAADDGMFTYNRTDSMTLTQNFTGIGGDDAQRYAFRKLRASNLTLTPTTANTYTGGTRIELGTLTAGNTTAFSPNSKYHLDPNTASTLAFNSFSNNIRGLTGGGGAAATSVTLGSATLTLSPLAIDALTYGGVISGTGNVVKNGAGTQILTAAQTYTGTTTVDAGSLTLGSLTGAAAVAINNSGSSLNINASSSVASLASDANSTLTLGTATAPATLTVADGGTTVAGVIREASSAFPGGITKDGSATLTLTGGNAYTGTTTVNDGTLLLGAASPFSILPDRSTIVIGATGTVDLNNNNETVGGLSGVAGATLAMGTGSLITGLNNSTLDFAGAITGTTGGLSKVGTGVQTLSGTNTFQGNVTITNYGGQNGGGLVLNSGAAVADTATIRISGWNTSLGVNVSEATGAVTGTRNTTIALGTGAALTSTYTNGAPTVFAATADSAAANGRIVRNINTAGLKPGDLISGGGVTAPGYVVQILDNDTVLVNRTPPAGPSVDFAPTVTATSVLNSALTGLGGFTKDGTGLLILTGNSTHSGATTINAGDVQIGGIWNGGKYSLHDALSDNSQLIFSATNATNLNFADSTTNLTSFERVGSLAGGLGATTTINLLGSANTSANTAVLAFGGDNSNSTFTGQILGGTSTATWLLKEGTGNFVWSNPTTNVFDGQIFIDGGGFGNLGAGGLDSANVVHMSNNSTTFTNGVTDTLAILEGGAGVSRVLPNGLAGGLFGSYLTGSANAVINTGTTMTVSSSTGSGFNGVISGAGNLTKAGASNWQIYGANTYTGTTNVNAGTLTLGALSRSAGVGVVSTSDIRGSLSDSTILDITGGTFNLNGFSETVALIDNSAGAGTIALVNGSLTAAAQNTQGISSVITGNLNSVLNLNAPAAATVTLTGNSNTFGGSVNVGANAALTLNRAGGAMGDTARVNLNGAGTQLTVTLADTIGSIAGSGNAVLTQALTIQEGRSGTYSAVGYSGATSGAGALILSNYGGLTLSGVNGHTGGTTLSSTSLLNLNYGAGSDILPSTGALTLNGGRIQVLSSAATATILESVASTTLNAGASEIVSWANFQADAPYAEGSGLGGINLGVITRNAGGTLNVTSGAAASSISGAALLGGWATFDGSTWAVGNGTAAAITGLTTFSADVFGAGLNVDITVAGANAGGSANTLRFSGANATDITGATTIASGGILLTRSVDANITTISGALSATGNELIIHQNNRLGDLVLTNVASGQTITTAGGGKTLITNDIGGAGTTNVGNGYLQLGDATVGGSTTGMVGSGAILNNGTIGFNRSNAVSIASAIISGTGNIEQLGTGTTTLGAANTFQGRATVRAGILEITNNAGLGAAATAATNRWANLTSVNTGGTLLLNVAAGGTMSEVLNLDGGTLDLRSTVATTLAAPIVLSSDSTIHVSNPGAAVSHVISGDIIGLPGADLTISNVGGASPSTLILAPVGTAGARWENTTITAGGRLQIGNNSRGFIGTGSVVNNGELIYNINDGHYVIGNNISGSGNFTTTRNTVYFTADNTYSGTTTIGRQAENVGVSLRIGNDTYTGMHGTGAITVQAVTGGSSDLRYHLIADNTIANNITLNANSDGTTARNATLLRQGIGNINLTGNLTIGATNAPAPGSQRAILQTEAGGILSFDGTLVGGGTNNLLNITNNGIFRFGGSASNSYNGVLSGNNVWLFDNTGTTTLLGANSVNTANSYLRSGTLVLGTGGVNTWEDSGDLQVFSGATLSIAGNETFDVLYTQRGSTTNIASGATLTLDGAASQLQAGAFTGTGNLTLALGNFAVMYGTNTISGNLNINQGAVASANLTNAIGSFTNVTLGSAALNGGLEYTGSGETFAKNLTLAGTGSNYIAANGTGALILSGNLTATGATSTLRLIGQTGGYFNPITNRVDGIISDGANVLSIAMTNSTDDDRFGITSRWALTNASNDFSGAITVNVGMLELTQLGSGADATSSMGSQTATRIITLGSNNFNGRRYDMFGNTDQLGDAGFGQGTNTLSASGDIGTIIFNDSTAGTATFGTNISWTGVNANTTNTTGMQLINDGVKTIVINGTLGSGTTGSHNWILDGSNTTQNTINGVISNPTTSQTTGLIKEGAGTWRLGGANTYTGTTTINNGILELSGGAAIADGNAVALNGDGGDGRFSGTAKLRVVTSETIGTLTGDVLTETTIDAGQTLTILGGNSTYNGLFTGAGNLSRTVNGSTAGTLTTSAKNTYTGITTIGSVGAATASAGISITHIADGGLASGIGASSNAASNLVFSASGTNGGVLTWTGYTNQSTDRLFTVGEGTRGAEIAASGTVVATTTAPTMTWSNTGSLAYTGTGARTLVLTGTTISENTFRPLIADNTGATSLLKSAAGLWLLDPVAGNSYTGGTTITGGTLAIKAGNALGTGAITINGGGGVGLQLRGGITLANNITNSTAEGGLDILSGTNILSGIVTSGVNFRVNVDSGASLEMNHATTAWAGAGQLLKLGNGNLILSGVNTNTAATFVRNGTLTLEYGTNNTSKLADAAALTLGGITIHTIAGVDPNVAGVGKQPGQSGGTVHLSGGTHLEVVSGLTLEPGSSAITRAGGSTAVLRLNGITRAVNQGTIDFGASGIADTDTTNTAGILGTTTTGAFATVAKTDWAFNSTNALDGAINALATYATDLYATGNNTDITVAAANTGAATLNNTFRFNANQATTLTLGSAFGVQGTAVGLQAGGILVTPNVGAFATVIKGGPLQNAASTVNFSTIVHQHNTAGVLEINSVIQNNTAATAQSLTKTGAGKLILSGLNTYTGFVNLYEGEIQVGGTAAAPNTATDAFLSGYTVTGGGNNSTGWQLAEGTTLRFLTTNTTIYNSPGFNGEGKIIMDTNNLGVLLLDDDNGSWNGDLDFFGGTIRVGNQANALGGVRGLMNIAGDINFLYTAAVTNSKITNYAEGSTVNIVNNTTTSTATWSGRQQFNNTTAAGLDFNIPTATTNGTVGLNITGVIYGTNGFTKSGNGILQLSANNFADVYDGYTGINKTATLSGQILINAGILYLGADGEQRALGAVGVGNETIVASGASLDLRNAEINWANDILTTREEIKISGAGFGGTGALRNTTGTGTLSFLTLDANATINGGGHVNASALNLANFDTNPSNANSLVNAFTANQPVINGGGFDLTIQGSRAATDNVVFFDPSFSSDIGNILVREGTLRITKETTSPTAFSGLSAADFNNGAGGIEIGYGGQTAADLTGAIAATTVTGPNVGARLFLANFYNLHNTVDITMNGTLAATNNGYNYLQADFFNIPDGTVFLDGDIALTGTANRNLIISDSVGNYTVTEQGNLTAAPTSKLVVGGQITGAGGFTKQGAAEVRLTNDNTFSGDLNVLRLGQSATPWESHTYKINGVDYVTKGFSEGWAEYSLTLNGANGAISDVANINLQRRGMITLDNTNRLDATSGVTGANNNNRIADDAVLNLNNGWLRLNTGSVANTETLGTINVSSGTNLLDIYGTDTAGVNTTLTITTLNRTAGGILRINNLDATSTFSTAAAGDSSRVAVTTLNASQIGGAGAVNTSTRSIVQGVFGGNIPLGLDADLRLLAFNNGNRSDLWNQQRNLQFMAGSHFNTMEGGFLRPLDDDEYFAPSNGLLNPTTTGVATQNVNLSDAITVMSEDTTINALRFGALTDHDGTGATGLNNHHAINLMVEGTLKISSGMISSAYFTTGNTSSSGTFILGGALDFNGQEAIINVQNGFFNTTDGTIAGGSLEIRSNITNAIGLTKTGWQTLTLDGANTYTGLTTISDGTLFLRNGRTAAGVGGAGNGIVVTGNGSLNSGNGIQVGTAASREDILIGVLNGDNQVMRNDNDVTNWFSNVTLDNVDLAGQALFTPRIRTDNSATSILNGNLFGSNTVVSEDVLANDPRRISFNSAGNNVFIIRGQIGDKDDGSGGAIPVALPVSTLPTSGLVTNENNVLRVDLGGGTFETNYHLERQYNAAGRLTLESGNLLIDYDPTAGDGTGFWTTAAIGKIANADSLTPNISVGNSFLANGSSVMTGFQFGTTGGTGVNNGNAGLFLTRPNQVFNMASWQSVGTGNRYIGGLNETGTVTFGNGNGTLQFGDNGGTTGTGAVANLYAMDGGKVSFAQRMVGNIGTIANQVFGFVKQGLGTVELQNSTAGAGTSAFVLAGGTLILNHTAATNVAIVGNTNVRFDGGTVIVQASPSIATTEGFATADAANRLVAFSIGGSEIVARTTNTGTPRNMTLSMGNANANGTTPTSNFTRNLGATANLVEDSAAGGTAQITLNFNATTTAAVKNQVIPWATYGTLSRTATDFAMSDAGNGNDVRAYNRALDEYNNNVASWAANQDVSENGGAGFSGGLGGALSLSTLRFDANADSIVNLGANVLTVAGNGLSSSGGGILVSSNVGSANKTITGGAGAGLTTSGGRVELILHHYGTGNLNINVPITGAGVDLVIAGPSTTNASTIGTTGAVVLNGTNTYDGQTFINGSVLSIDSTSRLGPNPASYNAGQLTLNGGTLRYTGTGFSQTAANTGVTFGGNGGTIDVVDGAGELRIANDINSDNINRGDLIKVGAGTLTLVGGGNANNELFQGLIDVRQGTLRLAGDVGNNAAGTSTIMGTNNSYADGTILRSGTNLAIQMGNGNDSGEWVIDEWITFKGNNYVSVGTINTVTSNTADTAGATEISSPVLNPNNERIVNLGGILTLEGATTFDVVSGQTFRVGWNGSGSGYLTGNGDIFKDGQGTMEIRTNNPDYTGNLTVMQGRLMSLGQADPSGTGYLTGKTITIGSNSRQGTAEFAVNSESGVHNQTTELNHDVNVIYNPTQTKRLTFETFGNGARIDINGDITLNDNLNLYVNDTAENGGSQNYVNLNGVLKDGLTTSGNLVFTADEADGTASNSSSGRTYNYLVMKSDSSAWTGDVRVNTNTSYDQDQTAILRLEHATALTAANDVDMGYNSILQIGGGARTIGALSTNGGAGPFIGGTAGGTMGASTNGSTEIIENAAITPGTLTITQSTPAATEVQWDAHFRDGTLNSQFFAPGSGPIASAALNVVKTGDGWATLTVDNAYTGTTTVSAGILQVGRNGVGDTGAITAAGLTAAVNTIIAGTGQIHGSTIINGSVKPGDEAGGSMGTLTFTAAATLGATSVSTLQIQRSSFTASNALGYNDIGYGTWAGNGTATGLVVDSTYSHLINDPVTTAQHDKLIVVGALTVTNGATKIVLTNNGYTPSHGDVFNLVDWGSITGTFNVGGVADSNGNGLWRTGAETGYDLDLFELGGAFRWDVSLFNTAGIVIVVVPEPSRALLMLLGLLGLALRRRRRLK